MKSVKKKLTTIIFVITLFITITNCSTVSAGAIKIVNDQIGMQGIDSFNIGDTIQLVYYNTDSASHTSGPVKCINNDVQWSSSDNSVATVSDSGLVTIIGYGNTAITASAENDNIENFNIYVYNEQFNRIILYKDDLVLSPFNYNQRGGQGRIYPIIGSSFQLKYRNTDGNIINSLSDGITWESADPSVVSIDEDGLVNALGNGTSNVKAYISGELVGTVDIQPVLFEGCEINDASTTYSTSGASISGVGEQLVKVPNTGKRILILSIITGVVLIGVGIGTIIYVKKIRNKNKKF